MNAYIGALLALYRRAVIHGRGVVGRGGGAGAPVGELPACGFCIVAAPLGSLAAQCSVRSAARAGWTAWPYGLSHSSPRARHVTCRCYRARPRELTDIPQRSMHSQLWSELISPRGDECAWHRTRVANMASILAADRDQPRRPLATPDWLAFLSALSNEGISSCRSACKTAICAAMSHPCRTSLFGSYRIACPPADCGAFGGSLARDIMRVSAPQALLLLATALLLTALPGCHSHAYLMVRRLEAQPNSACMMMACQMEATLRHQWRLSSRHGLAPARPDLPVGTNF